MLKSQAPYFYRFGFGKAQITMTSDGPLPLGDPSTNFLGASKEEISKLLTDNYLSPTNVVLEQNCPIVNTGTHLVLFDTGMGTQKMFGPTTGRLLASMREAGIQPGQIDAIAISHAHIDHIGGMVDARGRRLFPNAKVYINQADFDFWTDEKKLTDDKVKVFVKHARDNLMPYRDRITFIKDGQEIVLTIHHNSPSFFIDRWNHCVTQRVHPNQRVEICEHGWWDRGDCRIDLG